MANLAKQNRVVVTGLGAIAANGIGKDAFWKSLIQGQSGIGLITLFDASSYPVQIAGEVKNFDFSQYAENRFNVKRLARHTQLAIAATKLAINDAGLTQDMILRCEPVPVVIGVSSGAIEIIEQGKERLMNKGPKRVSSYIVGAGQPHAVSSSVARVLGVRTTLTTISSACPAGLDAIENAASMIRSGKAEIAMAGGTDAPINPLTVACFNAAGMLPKKEIDPSKASRPFDRDRQGGILAEGAGMIVLESLEHAIARGAVPLIEIRGYGSSDDCADKESASGLLDSMNRALANSCIRPENIDYICAHGPGDPMIDRVETAMIKEVFGNHAYSIPISSIKGVIGNPLAAAGVLQMIACAMAMQKDRIPPTANYENTDPVCDLDYVPKTRRGKIRNALINLHGLGGNNSSMVVQRVSGK